MRRWDLAAYRRAHPWAFEEFGYLCGSVAPLGVPSRRLRRKRAASVLVVEFPPTREELVEEAMRLYETRADLCQCDDCKRSFHNYFIRKDDQYLRDIIERAT